MANYLKFDFATTPGKGSGANCNWKGVPVNCGPRGLPPERNFLYRNNGDGTFADVSANAGIAQIEGGYGLTAVAGDFDEDGWPDIYVACDSTASLLFRNQGDGTFKEEGLLRGAALSEDGLEQAGMGVGSEITTWTAIPTSSRRISRKTRTSSTVTTVTATSRT